MSNEKLNVYGKNLKAQAVPSGNSRDTDSRALAACARRLDDARKLMVTDLKSKQNMAIYCEAIRHNQRLWTIFQVALCDPQNPLPQQLKMTLLNLSRYVDKTSFRAIGKFAPDLIDSLIEVNRVIANGLSKQTTGDAYAQPLQMPEVDTTALFTSA
jgi:flagellar biosynthesis regulator FlaF